MGVWKKRALITAFLALGWAVFWPGSVWGEELVENKELSPSIVQEIDLLGAGQDRTRPPTVTREAAENLAASGFPSDIIGLLVRLDRVSGSWGKMPLTPAEAKKLAAAGVSFNTIALMLESEIARVRSSDASDRPADVQGRDEIVEPSGRKVIVHRAGGASGRVRETFTRPDGRRVVIYKAGDSNRPVREVIDLGDGRQIVVHYAGEASDRADLERKQVDELERALKLLDRVQYHVYPGGKGWGASD